MNDNFKCQSDQIDQLQTALAKAQLEMGTAGLNSTNPFFKSKYADINDLIDASRPALGKYNLSVRASDIPDENGNMYMKLVLGHSSGQWVASFWKLNPSKPDVQAMGSVRSYAYRYLYKTLIGVKASDNTDDDGEATMERGKAYKITQFQAGQLEKLLEDMPDFKHNILNHFKINSFLDLEASQFETVFNRIVKQKNIKG